MTVKTSAGPFSEKNIEKFITALPNISSEHIRSGLKRARELKLDHLISACEAELDGRPFEFTKSHVADFASQAKETEGMSLKQATKHAFYRSPPSHAEKLIITSIIIKPGISYSELLGIYGKGDLQLVIGHLVYDRYGFFRRFFVEKETQSSVLLRKVSTPGQSVRYYMREDAEEALVELGASL